MQFRMPDDVARNDTRYDLLGCRNKRKKWEVNMFVCCVSCYLWKCITLKI